MDERPFFSQAHARRYSKDRPYSFDEQDLEIKKVRNDKAREDSLDLRDARACCQIDGLSQNSLIACHCWLVVLVPMSRCSGREITLRQHSHRGTYNPIRKSKNNEYCKSVPVTVPPVMPRIAILSQIRPDDTHWFSVGTAYFSTPERIGFAIAQFPIAHCGFGYINEEGDAGCEDADESGGDPA